MSTFMVVFNVFRSKMLALFSRPLLVNPSPSLGAVAMPWMPGVRDLTDHRFLVQVNHHHLRGVADVEPPGVLVNRKVIPATFAADRDFLEELIRTFCMAIRSCESAEQARRDQTEKPIISS